MEAVCCWRWGAFWVGLLDRGTLGSGSEVGVSLDDLAVEATVSFEVGVVFSAVALGAGFAAEVGVVAFEGEVWLSDLTQVG